MQEALHEFLAESRENLDRLDRDLLAIEASPDDRATLDSIFRTIHNLKGTCGFFNLPKLGSIAHSGESLLDLLRDGSIGWRPEVTDSLLALVDTIRRDLAQIEASGLESDEDHDALIEDLDRLRCGSFAIPPTPAPGPPEAPRPVPGPAPGQVRVDVDLLDRLMDLVGELVLTRNQALRHSSSRRDAELGGIVQRLNLVTTSLQEGVMKARMRPIGTIWDPLPRMVRDLARECGKLVEVELEGRGTELDRTVIEAIKDPFTHLVRNAVDHGIEPPEVRRAIGKPELGRLALRASHRGGLVHVEIDDDGAGIDPSKVASRALERGLITPDQAEVLGEDEAIRLLFRPGFSTAEAVTRVSGRGVGLDVVRANIEAIGGTIEVRTRLGRGSTVALKIPLTLAIIPTLIVLDARQDRYAIPQASLVELVHLEGDEVRRDVVPIDDEMFLQFREDLIPLVDLDHVLGAPPRDLRDGPGLNLAVLQADARRFGLVVETIGDTEEIVVKPLGRPIRSIPLFAGATILGDGRVSLILDVPGVARASGVASISILDRFASLTTRGA